MEVIDLFSGFGGSSTGAVMAGLNVIWAANHWQKAIEYHAKNHPLTKHICQDLQQADWSLVPKHDVLLASPCCQGHSKARGKANGNPQHDNSRSTAWAVISAVEYHKPEFIVIENVPEFLKWELYPAFSYALNVIGYSLSPNIIDCADLGVPQNRVRMFLIATKSKKPIQIKIEPKQHKIALNYIDFNSGNWSLINKKGRSLATLERIKHGRKNFGEKFCFSYYGNTKSSRSLNRPIGTLTTRDRFAIVNGDYMRMLTADEVMRLMSFPNSYKRPTQHSLTVHLAGNAVPPLAMAEILKAILES